MKDLSRQRTFESALHRGWFIQILDTDVVDVGHLETQKEEEYSFLFVIQKWWKFFSLILKKIWEIPKKKEKEKTHI